MPAKYEVTVPCPICKHSHQAPAVRVVDWSSDEEVKKKYEDGSLFEYSCPECGFFSRLSYSYLWQDPEVREYIYYSQEQPKNAAEADRIAAFAASLMEGKQEDAILRIVYSEDDLKEKLRIFENGLDDRLVEFCKGLALRDMPYTEELYVTDLRYMNIGGAEVLRILLSDGTEQYATNFTELYRTMESEYGSMLPPLRGNVFSCIDLEFAAAFLREL